MVYTNIQACSELNQEHITVNDCISYRADFKVKAAQYSTVRFSTVQYSTVYHRHISTVATILQCRTIMHLLYTMYVQYCMYSTVCTVLYTIQYCMYSTVY